MKERPILFSAPMVRAILENRKTQTRRVVKARQIPTLVKHFNPQFPDHRWMAEVQGGRWGFGAFGATEQECAQELQKYGGCPYGTPGDQLWVRETFQPLWADADEPGDWKTGKGYKPSFPATDGIQEFHDQDKGLSQRCWPSIHMPRWASRIDLSLTEVRVQRLQDISEDDATAEGVVGCERRNSYPRGCEGQPQRAEFAILWESINGKRPGCSWEANPWIWAISFKKISHDL